MPSLNPALAPLPPYAVVVVDHFGSLIGYVDTAKFPDAAGTYDDCVEFINEHLPPLDLEFAIVDLAEDLPVDYVANPYPLAFRIKLDLEDLLGWDEWDADTYDAEFFEAADLPPIRPGGTGATTHTPRELAAH